MFARSANLNIMVKAARKAARALIRDFGELENLQVSLKGTSDFVSAADIRAETILREELMGARPNYGWIGEESGAVPGRDPTRRWIVDPLDGTTNFLHALPHFAISIALTHRDEPVSAVIFDPVRDEMFLAEKGQGAWLDQTRAQTRLRVSTRKRMEEALFASGRLFGARGGLKEMSGEIAHLLAHSAGIRRFGAASLDLAWVAAGRYDGFWERGLKCWDVAAGALIVREAGGLVCDLAGGRDFLGSGGIIAANGALHETLLKSLRAAAASSE